MAFKKGEGGRQKGVPNKATADLKALAQPYSAEALDVLVEIIRDAKHPARLGAVRELLDRAHGKAPQAITGGDGGALAILTTVIHEHHTDVAETLAEMPPRHRLETAPDGNR